MKLETDQTSITIEIALTSGKIRLYIDKNVLRELWNQINRDFKNFSWDKIKMTPIWQEFISKINYWLLFTKLVDLFK